jgi:hypothetical protein
MTITEFTGIINANDYITAQGIGILCYNPEAWEIERQNAYGLHTEANICEQWLAQCTKTKRIQKKIGSSFDLTIKFQQWYREDNPGKRIIIPDGALLIAAIHLGFDCKKVTGVPSFYMNLSNKHPIEGRWLNDSPLASAVNFYL